MASFNIPLEVDTNDSTVRAGGVLDEEIKMLGRYSNTVAVNGFHIIPQGEADPGQLLTDMEFVLIAHAHPECSFEWVRLIVDLKDLGDVVISDMFPLSQKSTNPIKYVVGDKKGLKFEVLSIKLGPSYERSNNVEINVYFEEIMSSGRGRQQALWDFRRHPKTRLHLENLMKLKLSHQGEITQCDIPFRVEAKLKINGLMGLVPLVGSRVFTVSKGS